MTIDVHDMGIDTPDMKFVIQCNIPLLFNLMIQRMGQAKRKGGTLMFVFFILKWTRLKDPNKIKKRNGGFLSFIAVNLYLSNSNRPKALPKICLLSQVINTKNDLIDSKYITLESTAESKCKFEIDEEIDHFSDLFGIKTNKY